MNSRSTAWHRCQQAAIAHLRVACAQIAPSDDAIISEHLRAALDALESAGPLDGVEES
jgi:tellurite resistance protein